LRILIIINLADFIVDEILVEDFKILPAVIGNFAAQALKVHVQIEHGLRDKV
jgi:hypothetical protein